MISHIIWDVNPEIFDGIVVLRWYGVCWVLGIILGQRIMVGICESEGITAVEVDRLTLYIIVGAIIGARLGHILFYDPIYYLRNPIEILPIRIEPTFQFTGFAGLASHGGVVGALLALFIYQRRSDKSYLWLLDRLIIPGAAVGGFIRLGNLMNSEMIGTPSDLPWAFVFTHVDNIPRHPSQLYEAIFYFVVCVLLYFTWRSGRFNSKTGFIFGLGMTLIFTQRFLVEFIKIDQVPFEENLVLNMGQVLSIPMILAATALVIWSSVKYRND